MGATVPATETLRLLPRRYELRDVLGETPRSIVVRVHDASLGRDVALKVHRRDGIRREEGFRFRREFGILASLSHPNIVPVFDFGFLDGSWPYFTMELVRGRTLDQFFDGHSWAALSDLILQIASGLNHIHDAGVVHLDVKPSNILVDEAHRVRIMDFGLAIQHEQLQERRIRGTLHYMAPEVLRQDRVDHRADQYSLGVSIYETIIGALPTRGLPPHEIIRFHLEGEFARLGSVNPAVPADLERLVMRLLEHDPRNRFPTTTALLHEVARIAGLDEPREALVVGRRDLLVPPLIGRDHSTRQIEEALERARRGHGGGILVIGEEGVGKSRTVREVVLRAQLSGARVFQGRCPINGKTIYAPFYEIFQQIVHTVNPEADSAAEVRRIVRSASEAAATSISGEKFRLFNRVAQSIQDFHGFLNAVESSGSPMILVIEDLQWADRATRELLTFLVSEARSSSLLIIGVITQPPRDEAPADAAAGEWLERAADSAMEIIRISALREPEIREFLASLLGADALPQDLVRWMTWESAGNPTRIRGLVDALVERQLLSWDGAEWVADMPAIQQLRFPGGAAAAWNDRVKRLPLGDRTLLQIAAVFGDQFELDDVASIAGIPVEEVYATMERLAQDDLVQSAESDGSFQFPQAGAREAVYSSLAEGLRTDLHCRAGELLEERWKRGETEAIGQLAYHFARGSDYARGIDYSLEAGEQACDALVFDQAAEFFASALELMDLAGEEERKFDVRERLGDAYLNANHLRHAMQVYQFLIKSLESRGEGGEQRRRSASLLRKIGRVQSRRGDHEGAVESFERAAGILSEMGDRLAWAEMLGRQAASLGQLGRSSQAAETAHQAAELLRGEPETSVHGYLEQTLGHVAAAGNERDEALERFREAIRIGQASGSGQLVRSSTAAMGDVLWKLGRWDEALECLRGNLEASERDGDLWDLVHAYLDVARIEASMGNWHAAAELLGKTIRIDQRLGLPEHEAVAQMQLGVALERIGRWTEARERLEKSISMEGFDESRPSRVAAYLPLARIATRTGEVNEALELAQRAYETARRTRDEELGAESALTLAEIEASRDNYTQALQYAEEALHFFETASVRPGCVRALAAAADLALRQQSVEKARGFLDAAIEMTAELRDDWTAAAIDAVRARLLYIEGSKQEAEVLARELEQRFDALDAPWEAGRMLLELGLLREDSEEAAAVLNRAARIFDRLGAVHDADRARGAIARIRPAARRQESVIGLYEIVKIINSTLDVDEVLHRVLDLALRRLHADRGMIMLVDPVTGELRTRVARHLGDEESPARSPQTIIREVMNSGRPLISADAREDERFSASHSIVAENVVSVLCVPLVIRDRICGAIYVDHREASHLFTQRDLNFIEAFADQAAIAIENARLYQEIDEARARLTAENESLRREVLVEKHLDSLIGSSEAVARIQFAIRKASSSTSTVLLRGESGTGKGLVARIIHNISQRRNGPFIHFNCAALPETLAESELFGHERGAFTGADRRKPGRFELANGGTIFLDEIGKIGLAVQAKLLRVVEEKEFERVGGTQTIHTDVKVIAATNLDLERAIAEGTFREDLFYRLNIIPIQLPPLRERREDIPALVEYFMRKICRELGLDLRRLETGVLDLFLAYDWPGNVRELEAVVHRAIVMSSADVLRAEDFVALIDRQTSVGGSPAESNGEQMVTPEYYEEAISRLDRRLIQRALEQSDGRIREAARRLGLARNTLKARMQKYGVAGQE